MARLFEYQIEQSTIIGGIDDIFASALIEELYNDKSTHSNCCTIDANNDIIRHTKQSFKYIPSHMNMGLNLLMFNISTDKSSIQCSSNILDSWLDSAKKADYIFIHNLDRRYYEIVSAFIEKVHKKYTNTYVVVIDKEYTNENIQTFDKSEEIVKSMKNDVLKYITEGIDSAQSYIFKIIGHESSISAPSFLKHLASRSGYISPKSISAFNSKGYFLPTFSLDELNQDITLDNETKIVIEVSKAIDLIKRYDPFNLPILSHFYKIINFDNLEEEMQLLQKITKGHTPNIQKAQTKELKAEIHLIKAASIYNSRETSHNDYVLVLKQLYNTFNNAYDDKENYTVIKLGLFLFPQLNNISEIDLSRKVYVKLLEVLSEIEGEKSLKILEQFKFKLSYLSTAIISPMTIINNYPEFYSIQSIELLHTNSKEVLYAYSNILGSLVTSGNLNEYAEEIYMLFKHKYTNNSIELPIKVLNNLSIYEMCKKSEYTFTPLLKEHVESTSKIDSSIIIAINNLLFLYPENDTYLKTYANHHDRNDEFYVFYYEQAINFIKKNHTSYDNTSIRMYEDLDIKVYIENQLTKRTNNIFSSETYLFIDNQFWGVERE